MKKLIILIMMVLVVAGCVTKGGQQKTLQSLDDLTSSEIEALKMALDDEYKAMSIYNQVIDDHGNVLPFINIVESEKKHINSLVMLFNKYGIEVPGNDWPSNVPSFETVKEACDAGVQAEIDNAALYDELKTMTESEDILRVFDNLQSASTNQHLPAFQYCEGQ